jgi:DNA polymerase-3 subunit delta
MKPNDFRKQLQENRVLPVYLFLGEERLLHQELLQEAVAKLLTAEEREFNLLRLDAAATGPEELQTNLETGPFFGPVRIVYLDGLEKADAETQETLLGALANLADGLHLFVSAAKLDGRRKLHQEIQKRFHTVECGRLSLQDLPVWIDRRAKEMGVALTAPQIRLMAQRLGSDLLLIRTELEKLALFSGGKAISDSAFEDLLPGEPEPDIFALIDAVAAQDPKLGMPRLEELLNAGENEIKILATLARQVRNILAALEARSKGLTPKDLTKLFGIKPFVAEKSFVQSGRFRAEDLHRIMERLLLADYRMKTGQMEPRLELELAVAEICGMGETKETGVRR